jgi:hypothetical protein
VHGSGVLLALREEIQFNKINSAPWSDNLEILAIELLTDKLNKCLLCVCYRPPNSDLNEWFNLFASFLLFAEKYEKILLLGDFIFPDLVWNCGNASQNLSSSSVEFRDLVYDFFLEQVNPCPTRLNNILDLILTNTPESVTDISCLSPESMDICSDNNLLFFEFKVFVKLSSSDSRTVLDYRSADWEGLYSTVSSTNLSSSVESNEFSIDNDWKFWCDCFMDAVYRHIATKIIKKRNLIVKPTI